MEPNLQPQDQAPGNQAQLLQKNCWLVRTRWFYPAFVLILLMAIRFLRSSAAIDLRSILLVFLLALVGNAILAADLRKKARQAGQQMPGQDLLAYAAFQLDFDLVLLALNIYFSGVLESPLLPLFIFHVMVSTFLTTRRKSLRNTLTAMALLFALVAASNRGLHLAPGQLAVILTWDMLLVLAVALSSYFSARLRENEALARKMSISDGLTGLYNQSHFLGLLDAEVTRSRRYGNPCSLIMFDVDNFKTYNDRCGHSEGSAALRRIGRLMKQSFRSTDILAKYGGDEFMVLMCQTASNEALVAAERLRKCIDQEPFPGGATQPLGRVTLSMGIACFPEHGQAGSAIIASADAALYQAKENGRNRIQLCPADPSGVEAAHAKAR